MQQQNTQKLQKINLSEKFSKFEDLWCPKSVGSVNNQSLKLVKIKGEFVWHKHDNDDELFMVIEGSLVIKLRDQENIELNKGEIFVVPKGVEHCPVSENGAQILIIEPLEVVNTGDVKSENLTRDSVQQI